MASLNNARKGLVYRTAFNSLLIREADSLLKSLQTHPKKFESIPIYGQMLPEALPDICQISLFSLYPGELILQ